MKLHFDDWTHTRDGKEIRRLPVVTQGPIFSDNSNTLIGFGLIGLGVIKLCRGAFRNGAYAHQQASSATYEKLQEEKNKEVK